MIKLETVIDEFMLEISDPRHILNGTNRTLIERRAKRGVEELGYSAGNRIKVEGFEVPETKILKDLPFGYVDYVRLSWIDEYGYLVPLYVNYNNPISYSYLRDDNNDFVFTAPEGVENVNPIEGGAVLVEDELPEPTEEPFLSRIYNTPYFRFSYFFEGGISGIRGGYDNNAPTFRYIPQTREFRLFNIDTGDRVILEYISSPLGDTNDINEIEIHEYLRETLHNYIYYNLVKTYREVPAYEKQRAKDEYYNLLRVAKNKEINIDEIVQAAKTKRAFNNW